MVLQNQNPLEHMNDLKARLDNTEGQVTTKGEEYSAEKKGSELEDYIEEITETVRLGLDQSIAILTPWFFNNMPKTYYQTTPRSEKIRHLSAIITGHVFETKQTVELWDRTKKQVTYIGPGTDRKILTDMASKLQSLEIKIGSLYFSRDSLLFLSSFCRSGHVEIDRSNPHISAKIAEARRTLTAEFPGAIVEVENYLNNLDNDFVMYATANRICITFQMVMHMMHHEGAHTFVKLEEGTPIVRLTVGMKGIGINEVLENVLSLIGRYEFDIVRAFLVQVDKGYAEPINTMHFVMSHKSGRAIEGDDVALMKLIKSLRTLGWVDSDDYAMLMKPPYMFSISSANLIRSMAAWVHILLGKENSYYYSEYKIFQTFKLHSIITTQLVELFKIRFSPLREAQRKNDEYTPLHDSTVKSIEEIIDRVERTILKECVGFIDNVLKTNYFLHTKTGLAFRIDSNVLDSKYYPQKPFSIFFITGRHYRFFQVRWKDISRGGLRVVLPRSTSDHGYALSGLFDEVYGLSMAQQLKNKDIPEGGSKAVMVLNPDTNKVRAVRGAINALLDLLVNEDESHEEAVSKQVSYYGGEDIIYLGPDENMSNDLIEWITEQADRRGYKYARAFMSSKPKDGINHKEYGVTSHGLHVFVEEMLRYLAIDPTKRSFTIKMTGGPDGDVAGNELKILHSKYAKTARVVAIADGFGAAYDPNGLNWNELIRLVNLSKSIAYFGKKKLSGHPDAFVIKADTSENIRRRNELHFNAEADLFIPAGGRPYTVNRRNCERFLKEDGTPTCRAIVEGANIFFTTESRVVLQKAGIHMIKDSSANKTGVICSSFEIIASLLLSSEEFLEIKTVYIEQVIKILKERAALEANMLFSNYRHLNGKKTLVELSEEISFEINSITDTLLEAFTARRDESLADPLLQNLIINVCPPILAERYRERILEKLPKAHQIAILASFMASYIVYHEGLGWVDSMGESNRFATVIAYMKNVRNAGDLIRLVEESVLDDRSTIVEILRRSAARDLTAIFPTK